MNKEMNNEWISVKDRFPEFASNGFSDDVLVYIPYTGQVTAYLNKYGWHPVQDAFEAENFDGRVSIKICDQEAITHWMPLPEEPTE